MARANFFSKNAFAAAQLLNGMSPDALGDILDRHVVGISFDASCPGNFEAEVTLELAVNLAARLYPSLAILSRGPRGEASDALLARLVALARTINPDLSVVSESASLTAVVVVGFQPLAPGPECVVYAGSSGWYACGAPDRPVGSGVTAIPFGAAAAACIALANVFRFVFAASLPAPERDEAFALSVFDYHRRAMWNLGEGPPIGGPEVPRERIGLGDMLLAGVGAVGNAVVWTLARTAGLAGMLGLIDHESVSLSNLQRYVLATQDDACEQRMKVAMAQAALLRGSSGTSLQVQIHPVHWGDYLSARGNHHLECVATAFDTVDARLAVQAALPRRLLNAWTQQADLGISRHLDFGRAPCLACLYPRRAGGKSEAESVAAAMRVPEPAWEIRELLYSHGPIDECFIRGVAERRNIRDPERVHSLLQFVGRPLREFYQEAFCGGLVLLLGGQSDLATATTETPIAFQSALAGVLLAAEIVIDAAHLGEIRQLDGRPRIVIDLLRPLSVYIPLLSRSSNGRCLCEDTDYLAAYEAKYHLSAR